MPASLARAFRIERVDHHHESSVGRSAQDPHIGKVTFRHTHGCLALLFGFRVRYIAMGDDRED